MPLSAAFPTLDAAMRGLVLRGFRRAGFARIRHPSPFDLIRDRGVRTIIDVGANDGGFAAEARRAGFAGTIVSFEPVAAAYAALTRRAAADPRWFAYNLALGEQVATMAITVPRNAVYSSFKALTGESADRWPDARAGQREEVRVERLDAFLDRHPEHADRMYLKLDTQGFELEALRGAGAYLDAFVAIQAELALRPLYQGQRDWIDTALWLRARGYAASLVKENAADWQAVRLLEVDAVFERTEGTTTRADADRS